MAPKVGFFTPVSFGTQPKSSAEWLLEKVDGYFYLGGPKAHILKTYHPMKTGEVQEEAKAVLVNENQSFLMTCLKVASYFTILLPTIPLITKAEIPLALSYFALVLPIMLITKAILRLTHSYEIDRRSIKDRPHQQINLEVLETLELSLNEQAAVDASKIDSIHPQEIPTKHFTLRQAATEVIANINEAIAVNCTTRPEASLKEKHCVVISTAPPWIENGSNLYYYAHCLGVPFESFVTDQEQLKNSWFNRILKALADRNHIQVVSMVGHRCCIQA